MKRSLAIVALLALAGCASQPSPNRAPMITSLALPAMADDSLPHAQSDSALQLFLAGPDGMVARGPIDAATSMEVGSDGIARLK